MNPHLHPREAVAALALAFALNAVPLSGANEPGILEMEADFARAVEKVRAPQEELLEKYRENLEKLMEEVRQGGDLDATLAVKQEIQSPEEERERDYSRWPELKRLRDIYEKAHLPLEAEARKQQARLIESYRDRLVERVEIHTREGRIEDAVLFDQKRKHLEKLLEEDSVLIAEDEGSGGDWLRISDTKWKWQSGGELILQRNRRATHTRWRGQARWQRTDDERVEVIAPDGRIFILNFKNQEAAEVIGPDGGTTKITIIDEG